MEILFVYGDPKYYGRFGFTTDAAIGYAPPYKLEHPFGWMAVSLNERSSDLSSGKVTCVAPLCDPELW